MAASLEGRGYSVSDGTGDPSLRPRGRYISDAENDTA
jgi:hypothetical protein